MTEPLDIHSNEPFKLGSHDGRTRLNASRKEELKQARRRLVNEILPKWKRPCAVSETDNTLSIDSPRRGFLVFDLNVIKNDFSPRQFALLRFLIDELKLQAETAWVAVLVANAELCLQDKRLEGAASAGRKSRKSVRPEVEGLMRAAIRRGEDPGRYLVDWAQEYGYSVRQMRTILDGVRKGRP